MLTNGISWLVVFHNVKSLDLLCFVHPEHSKNHERSKDDDCSYGVPGNEGTASKSVPHEHPERSLSSSEKDSTLYKEGCRKEAPTSSSSVNRHCIQRVVDLEKLIRNSFKVTLNDSISLEKKT